MTANFPSINLVFNDAIGYYKIGRIRDHIFKLSGKINYQYLDDSIALSYKMQEHAVEEIKQHIHGSTANVQVEMFMYLKNLIDFLKTHTNESIKKLIDDYNNTVEKEFNEKIDLEVLAFQKSTTYLTRKHGEEYEEEISSVSALFGGGHFHKYKIKKVHYKYYAIERGAEYIDTEFLPGYFELVNDINGHLLRLINYYVDLWDAGKITSNATIIVVNKPTDNKEQTNTLEVSSQERKKLKMNLSVTQLAYLFKLLYDSNMIENTSKADLTRFIVANFSTKMSQEISEGSLANKLSVTEKAEANFWADELMKMHKAAKKV